MANEIDKSSEGVRTDRTARCACGGLKIHLAGEPASVYACTCLECQRATGSAFAYRARFGRDSVVAIDGERRVWRRGSDAGRWVEQIFCPTCGTLVYMQAEASPDAVVVSVGCFADPEFAAPVRVYRATRRHRWYELAAGSEFVD
jgi:hypothetical protein